MLKHIPSFLPINFILTTLSTLVIIFFAIKRSDTLRISDKAKFIFFGLLAWVILQAVLSITNFYSSNITSLPPKIVLTGILPLVIFFIYIFNTATGQQFIDSLPLTLLTYLNIVRIPVEIVLYGLYLHKAVPQIMTFDGRNFDILAGITTPIVAYLVFNKKTVGPKFLLIWNILCLGLLVNIIFLAFFSSPTPLQMFGMEQPNIAILYFPYTWLPTFIAPMVFFGHLIVIRRLLKAN